MPAVAAARPIHIYWGACQTSSIAYRKKAGGRLIKALTF